MKSYILIGVLAFIFGYSFGLLAYLVANDKVDDAKKVIIDYTTNPPTITE